MKKLIKIALAIILVAGIVLAAFILLKSFRPEISDRIVENEARSTTADKLPDTKVSIVGDISLADNWTLIPAYDSRGKGVNGILSDRVLEQMRQSDFMIANSEFTVSERGTPIPGKAFTFRAHPSRLSIYDDMSVDLVTLANNHVYDFGRDAFYDMLDAFDNKGLPHIGAGRNLEEAKKAYYYKAPSGQTIAFVNASRAEKWGIDTPGATENEGGILLCYDTTEFIDAIRTAKANSDIVVAIIHWGTELSHNLEQVQIDTAKDYIDAGADMIVGGHAHTLQGIDFYNGKPIIYNLGDFIFNDCDEMTAMFQFTLTPEGKLKYYFKVGHQANQYTDFLDGAERADYIRQVESWSPNIQIADDDEIIAK